VVQVAYTTAYGPVMPGYPAEPIMTESHLDTATCIYQTNDNCMSAVVDDAACFEAVSGFVALFVLAALFDVNYISSIECFVAVFYLMQYRKASCVQCKLYR